MYIIAAGLTEAVELLIKKGANVTITNKIGDTALMMAAYKGNLTEPAPSFNKSLNPLISKSTGRTTIIEQLLKNGANVNHVNKDGNTALIYAANKSIFFNFI